MKRTLRTALLLLFVVDVALVLLAIANARNERHYAADNKQRGPLTTSTVFLGDSITAGWAENGKSRLFSNQTAFADRGINGDHALLMLFRLPNDVFGLHPKTVVFLGGTNDLKSALVPNPLRWVTRLEVEFSIRVLAFAVNQRHERLILCSLPPVDSARVEAVLHVPAARMRASDIVLLNEWIRSFALSKGLTYVDYYAALNDGSGKIQYQYSDDGIHPNAAGYERMMPLVLGAITSTEGRR